MQKVFCVKCLRELVIDGQLRQSDWLCHKHGCVDVALTTDVLNDRTRTAVLGKPRRSLVAAVGSVDPQPAVTKLCRKCKRPFVPKRPKWRFCDACCPAVLRSA